MIESKESICKRPMVKTLGNAAYCNFCGADRGESCRLELPTPEEWAGQELPTHLED